MHKTKHQAQNDMLIAIYDLIAQAPFSDAEPTPQHGLIDILAAALAVQSHHGRTDERTLPIDESH